MFIVKLFPVTLLYLITSDRSDAFNPVANLNIKCNGIDLFLNLVTVLTARDLDVHPGYPMIKSKVGKRLGFLYRFKPITIERS